MTKSVFIETFIFTFFFVPTDYLPNIYYVVQKVNFSKKNDFLTSIKSSCLSASMNSNFVPCSTYRQSKCTPRRTRML